MSTKTYRRVFSHLYITLGAFVLASGLAHANPENGQVVGGNASIETIGKKLNVKQTSQKAIINWNSFNIAPDEHTQFHQPDASSFTLNRVQDTNPSNIQGMLTANGNIAIINPNGIYFDKGAQVDVGGLVASSADISDDDFMNGRGNFTNTGKADAKIINNGTITAKDAGLVGLVAPHVENNGIIKANLGKVTLSSGDTFVYDFNGDNLINVAADSNNNATTKNAVNTGFIKADGGQVYMTAGDARRAVDSLVTNTGVIEAKSVSQKNGKIILSSSSGGGTATTLNHGTLNVSGQAAGETGGNIQILGDHVGAMENSKTIATGSSGGGEILIGGDYQGTGSAQTAQRTYIDPAALVDASATENGNGGKIIAWADDINRTYGSLKSTAGASGGDGGFVEISGKNKLDFQGQVFLDSEFGEAGTVLFDPTDLEISTASNLNVTGSSPFSPNLDNGPSILNTTTLLNAIASGNVTVQTSATGAQLGNITINDPLSWSANRTVNFTAHNKIIVNAPITARGTLNMTAADIDFNANMIEHASGANLYLLPRANNLTVGVAGGAGSFNLGNADLDFIQNGWNAVVIGASGGTAVMDVGTRTWNVPLTLRTSTGQLRINGTQTMGANSLTFQTRNLAVNNDLVGTGNLIITPGTNVTIGVAGGAGTLNISTAMLDHIINGWTGIYIGHASNTQAMNVNAYTWQDNLVLRSRTGAININATPNMGSNNLTLQGRNFVLNADLVGTGTLTLQPDTNVTVGVAGGSGTLNLSTALLDRIIDGWAGINIGLTSSTQAMNVNAYNWNDSVYFRTGTGVISIDGAQNVGANNLGIFTSGNPVINAPLLGSGNLSFEQVATNVTMGLAGQSGTYNLSTAELNQIMDGWSLISFGLVTNDAAMNVGAYTWNDSVKFQNDSGVITIAGAQNVGTNDLTIHSDANPSVAAPLVGSGTLTLEPDASGTTVGVAGGSGTYNLSLAELDQIADGWAEIIIGRTNSTAALNVNAYDWNDSLRLQTNSGVVNIAGTQNLGANNLRITTSGNLALNANLSGTGDLTIESSATNTTIGLAGASGTLNLSAAELDRMLDGWNSLTFGKSTGTGAMAMNAYTWRDDVTFQTNSGIITIAGAQDFGSNDLNIKTSGNLAVNSSLTGTGDLTIETTATNTSIGLAGGSGSLNLSAAELDRITDGWNSIHIGKSTGTGAITVNAYTWNDDLTLQTKTGAITIAGAQNMGANDLTLNTASLALNNTISGSGTLRITPVESTTSVGLAGGTGSLNLTTTELNKISDGWADIIIGRTDSTGNMNVNAYAWNDNLTLQTGTGALTFAGIQNLGTNNLTLNTSSLAVNANLNGAGNLLITPADDTTSIGLSGGAGALNLTTAEMARLNTGWTNITFGNTGASGITALGGDATFTNTHVTFETPTELSANAILNTGSGNLSFNNTLDGGFNLTINNTGNVIFSSPVGLLSRLGDLQLNNTANLTALSNLNVASLDVNGSTGTTAFNGAGLDSTGDVNIISNGITGTLYGDAGTLDSGVGTINALVGFTTLDIDGAGATLSAGYIGTPAAASQTMANLITKGGLPVATPSPAYMFDSFEIGYIAPVVNNPQNLGNTTFDEIVTILKQPASVDTKYQNGAHETSLLTPYNSNQTVADIDSSLILIHPDLLREDANPPDPAEQNSQDDLSSTEDTDDQQDVI